MELISTIFEFASQNDAVVLTLCLGAMSILMISFGSTMYSSPAYKENEYIAINRLKIASGAVLAGTFGMMAISIVSANPLFALPEVGALLTAFIPFFRMRSDKLKHLIKALSLHYVIAAIAIVIFIYTCMAYVTSVVDLFPALGITLASLAFGLIGSPMTIKTYRLFTITASVLLVIGSAYSGYNANLQNNMVGLATNIAFFILNGLFMLNEIRVRIKDMIALRSSGL